MTWHFKTWLWMAPLNTVLGEVFIYFAFKPEFRMTPDHVALMWLLLPMPATLTFFVLTGPKNVP